MCLRRRRRLLAALALIALAVGAQALFERHRAPHAVTAPPHEPSQALITPPQQLGPENAPGVPPGDPLHGAQDAPAAAPHASYVVQAGVFASIANAQALQERLAKAGISARLETRVQLGPYGDRKEAQAVLARLKQLGVRAVIVDVR